MEGEAGSSNGKLEEKPETGVSSSWGERWDPNTDFEVWVHSVCRMGSVCRVGSRPFLAFTLLPRKGVPVEQRRGSEWIRVKQRFDKGPDTGPDRGPLWWLLLLLRCSLKIKKNFLNIKERNGKIINIFEWKTRKEKSQQIKAQDKSNTFAMLQYNCEPCDRRPPLHPPVHRWGAT